MTLYNDYDLMIYFYIYAFIGWIIETVVIYIKDGKVHNRGILNEPLILKYGSMMILLILGSGVSQAQIVLQFIINIFRVIIVERLARFITNRSLRLPAISNPPTEENKDMRLRFVLNVVVATATFTTFKLIHPFIFLLVSMIPLAILKVICLLLFATVTIDYILVCIACRRYQKLTANHLWQEKIKQEKLTLSYRLVNAFHIRLERAYPELRKYTEDYAGMDETESIAHKKGIIFAQGVCLDKLFWVFLVTAFLGDLIETVYVWLRGSGLMRRSGVVFGPFSIVWGIGAAVLTIVLYRLSNKGKWRIFIGGFLLGGTYEYMASVVLEVLFHTKFWDYSNMAFNIGGRTNLAYMFGWGFLSLVWVCLIYPVMSKYIETIPPIAGKIVTYSLTLLMCLDLAITGLVMLRYNERKTDPMPSNTIERYLDDYYSDADVEHMWPNLVVTKSK